MKIRNIIIRQIQTDESIIDRVIFANIWLSSDDIKYYHAELRLGIESAFNE